MRGAIHSAVKHRGPVYYCALPKKASKDCFIGIGSIFALPVDNRHRHDYTYFPIV